MRKILLQKGLTDPETGKPTKEGHLHGGAVYIERDVDGVPQRWPTWDVETIDNLFPDLSSRIDGIPRTFKDRFKAMDALEIAGGEICSAFSEKAINSDPKLQWLEFAPGHGSLMTMDNPKDRKDWAIKYLTPLRDHVHQRIKRLQKKNRGDALKGIERINGVIHWLTGGKPDPVDIGDPLPPHSLDIHVESFGEGKHTIRLNSNDMKILTSGWVFREGGKTPDEEHAHTLMMFPIYELDPSRNLVESELQWTWISKEEDQYHLLSLFTIDHREEWFGIALPVIVDEETITIQHEPSMLCTIAFIDDDRAIISEVTGHINLAEKIFAFEPD